MRTIVTAAILGLAAILLPGQVNAQAPPAPGGLPPGLEQPETAPPPPKDQPDESESLELKDIRKLVETVKMVRLSQELGFNDEQTVLLMRKYDRYRDQTEQLRRERQQLLRVLKESVKAGKPDAEIDKALKDLVAQDAKIANFRTRAFEEGGRDLTPTQQAKLYVFLSEFEEDMRRLIQRARQADPGRVMRLREMRDNVLERRQGPGGPEEQPRMPRPRPGPGMRERGDLNPPSPPGANPPPPRQP